MYIIKVQVRGLDGLPQRATILVNLLTANSGIERVDVNLQKELIRVVSIDPLEVTFLQDIVHSQGFQLIPYSPVTLRTIPADQLVVLNVAIDGMTCRSCEITIERSWKKINGIKKVDVNAHRGEARIMYAGVRPTIVDLQNALGQETYIVKPHQKGNQSTVNPSRPSWVQLIGLFALVLVMGKIFVRLGFLQPSVALGDSTSFGAVFLLGLVAASSSCIAVSGGLLLSSVATFNQRYGAISPMQRITPVTLFIGGRLVSYAVLGAVIGWIGKSLTPSPWVTGGITIIAALYMFVMGLDMLSIAPKFLKALLPRMPKRFTHGALDVEQRNTRITPLLLGGATFFLPCGFTQALQLYALTTGSALTSGLMLFAFALGTAPALFALGWASGSLKGKVGQLFFRFSGALVVVLGLWNLQNGFTITGHPLSWPNFGTVVVANVSTGDPNVSFDGTVQTIKMSVTPYGYEPNHFTVRAGVPTRWAVDARDGGGCAMALQAPQLGIRELLKRGDNVIELAPQSPGNYSFSCSMGMYRGQITVVPNG